VRGLLAALHAARDFDEAYRILGHRYVVDARGDLSGMPAGAFSLVVSATVLEHIPRDIVRRSIAQTFRLLRPGGHCAHGIDLGDHLAYYDPAIHCLKNYLRYSDRTWRLVFDNDIQYINRIRPAEWLSIFRDAGFEPLKQHRNTIDLTGVPIAEPFRGCATDDLACSTLFVVHRKPVRAAAATPHVEAALVDAPPV
jgi:SAM-dependent methyltransferase